MIGLSFDILSVLGREASKPITTSQFLRFANKKIESYEKQLKQTDK